MGMTALSLSYAQLWYNGDPDLYSGLACEINTAVSDSRVYDDFTLNPGASTVTGVFGNFFMDFAASQAYYEIRSGVSVGNGGTLVANGIINVSQSLNGFNAFGFNGYLISGAIPNLLLTPGTQYWLTLAPIGNGGGRAFLQTTSLANSVGNTTGGQAYWDSAFFGQSFSDTVAALGDQGFANYSLGVNGVPEPASMVALATGLVSLFARRRRK